MPPIVRSALFAFAAVLFAALGGLPPARAVDENPTGRIDLWAVEQMPGGNRIRLVARDGAAEFWRDGERIFAFRDPAPLAGGWFAIRTVRSHLVIRNLLIKRPGR